MSPSRVRPARPYRRRGVRKLGAAPFLFALLLSVGSPRIARAGEADETAPSTTPVAPAVLPAEPVVRAPRDEEKAAPIPAEPSPPAEEEALDYQTPRYEPAGFPLIGGDSDIGFEFGAVGTLTRFDGGMRPYRWNMDMVVAASVKSGPTGAEITQQNYLWQIDIPGVMGGRLRINPAISYETTVNQGYFGQGNASGSDRSQVPAAHQGRYFQYNEREMRVRELTRIAFRAPWDIMVATAYRHDSPLAYAGSKLAQDAASGAAHGVEPMSLGVLGLGFIYDTRDNEYFPRRGSYHQIGIRGVQALPDTSIHYLAFGGMFAHYQPVGRRAVLAMRGVVDAEFGKVPLLDLYTGGPFQTYEMLGGSAAVRGVPDGRYSGPLKVFGNLELRARFVDFHVLNQSFHIGGNMLFDAGRLWSNYTFDSPKDGKGVGIKWGAGLGAYLIWGQAAVFRVEVAYSPDAVAQNPSLPLGIYVEDGVMF